MILRKRAAPESPLIISIR